MNDFPVPNDARFEKLVAELALELAARGWKLATAESCTGGWIAKCCTDLAGSSAWFERGFVTYSDTAKKDALGVDARILQEAGAVSRTVALKKAEGERRRAGVDIAVAVTGIVCLKNTFCPLTREQQVQERSCKDHEPEAEAVCFRGDRDAVRRQTVDHALRGLIERLAP